MKTIGWLKTAAVCCLMSCLAGCSLLKVSVSTGDPLPKEQMDARVMTRGFYYEMAGEVTRAADSIVSLSHDPASRIAAVRWKIRATRAGVSAAMQSIPDVALADLWILCRRMDRAFAASPDSALFGPQSDIARNTARRLDRRADRIARQVLPSDRYRLMAEFVDGQVRDNPYAEGDASDNTTLAWLEYLKSAGVEHTYATGSIAEVLSDVNDRVSGQTQQLSNSIGWSKDILQMQFGQDSLQTQLGRRLDSLERDFSRMVAVAEHFPELSDMALEALNRQATELMWTMESSMDSAFADIDRQRSELQAYVSREREALVEQLRTAGNDLVQSGLDALPALVGKVLFYVVLALAVLVGGPFALGFWLGGVRQRARDRRSGSMPE
ncbi:MAG TPA: hypothetical protein H9879_01900 [Candidatus Alistipes intestinipullorum]|nr:hypothetical protein [Candidatus Alistipes intestinipullorum]